MIKYKNSYKDEYSVKSWMYGMARICIGILGIRQKNSYAIKFTKNDGAINNKAAQNIENVTILVSDNGVGIQPENIPKLFDISQVLTTTGTAEET